MTREQKIEHFLELAHRAGNESWSKFRMVWRGSADLEDFRSQAALFLIQAVDRKDWGIDAPGLFYNFILKRMADWVRNHKPGKRLYKGAIQFCGVHALRLHSVDSDRDRPIELQQILSRKASEQQKQIVRLSMSGLNQREVAEEIQISQSLVSRRLKEMAA